MDTAMTLEQHYYSSQMPFFIKVHLPEHIHTKSMTNVPEIKGDLETRLITSIRHERYELITPLVLEIKCIDHEYIVNFSPIGIFASGNDPEEAMADFYVLLVDYYESLLRKEKSLAINLRRELKILKQYLKKP